MDKPYFLYRIQWFLQDLRSVIQMWWFLHGYKKHLKNRIDKNNFGRREEW